MEQKKVKAIPDGMTAVTPHLVCQGAAQAIEFYQQAFNAEEQARIPGPDGRLIHAMIRIGNSPVMLVDEFPEWGSLSPKTLQSSPVTIHLYVEDVDAVIAQAVEAGATVVMPPEDMFWGDRYAKVKDPFGHDWSIATHIRDISMEEMMAAMPDMPECPSQPE